MYSHASFIPDDAIAVSIKPIGSDGKRHALQVGPGGFTLHATAEDLRLIARSIEDYMVLAIYRERSADITRANAEDGKQPAELEPR